MTLPQRKSTRLDGYDYSNGGRYFLTICAKNMSCIFGEVIDAERCIEYINSPTGGNPDNNLLVGRTPGAARKNNNNLELYGNTGIPIPHMKLSRIGRIVDHYITTSKNQPGIIIDKYQIMPNHIHILLTAEWKDGEQKCSSHKTIPNFVSALKRLCNAEIGENVFQRSYHDHIIRGSADYGKIWDYIEGNPMVWGADKLNPANTK